MLPLDLQIFHQIRFLQFQCLVLVFWGLTKSPTSPIIFYIIICRWNGGQSRIPSWFHNLFTIKDFRNFKLLGAASVSYWIGPIKTTTFHKCLSFDIVIIFCVILFNKITFAIIITWFTFSLSICSRLSVSFLQWSKACNCL